MFHHLVTMNLIRVFIETDAIATTTSHLIRGVEEFRFCDCELLPVIKELVEDAPRCRPAPLSRFEVTKTVD